MVVMTIKYSSVLYKIESGEQLKCSKPQKSEVRRAEMIENMGLDDEVDSLSSLFFGNKRQDQSRTRINDQRI